MEEIEQQAEAVLARVPTWVWDGETLPVPVEDIADTCFGLLVRDVDDLSRAPGAPELPKNHALSGLLLPRLGEIWVSAGEGERWPGRRRFTICHELGHFCMHCRGGEALFCRSATIEPTGAPDAPEPDVLSIEDEAQAFAAAMLMPARLVQLHYADGLKFVGLCDKFGASWKAMGKRLHQVI